MVLFFPVSPTFYSPAALIEREILIASGHPSVVMCLYHQNPFSFFFSFAFKRKQGILANTISRAAHSDDAVKMLN